MEDSDGYTNVSKNKEDFFTKLFRTKKKVKSKPKEEDNFNIPEFFRNILTQSLDLKNTKDIIIFYQKEIEKAEKLGQTAYVEILKTKKRNISFESVLIDLGLTKFVTEKQVITFYEKVKDEKNLKLTWIKNFISPIPTTIMESKELIDTRKIFDNYVILHYDPKNSDTSMTKKEKERAKDPILFGVIRESKKLYFIADWKDEYCDLTIDSMFETLGEKVSEINNESVKTYIRELQPGFHTFEQFKD